MLVVCLFVAQWAEGASGTTLTGRVVLTGNPPPASKADVARDKEYCGEQLGIDRIRIDPATGGLSAAVVSIEGVSGATEPSFTPIVLNNRKCAFEPRVQVATANQPLELRNEDPVMHNTHIILESKTFMNVALLAGSQPISKRLKRPGLYEVRCDAHRFMRGYVWAFPHPYFSTTDEAGAFHIPGVPAGQYTVTVWHEALGVLSKTVAIPAQGEVTVVIEFSNHERAGAR